MTNQIPTTARTINGIELQVITADNFHPTEEQRQKNSKKRRRGVIYTYDCHMCGTPMTDKQVETAYHVHMNIDGDIVPVDAKIPNSESQGWFPIGSECARKVPHGWKQR